MTPTQFLVTILMAAVLLCLAAYFTWRQCKTLRELRSMSDLAPEDRRYVRSQAWRRLVCCALMVVFSGFLIGWIFLEGQVNEVTERSRAATTEEENEALAREAQHFVNFFVFYWIAAVLVLVGMLVLAAVDIWAIRRFGLRHYRQIQADRRDMIENQVALLRSRRNGQH